MKNPRLLALLPLFTLAACGGGDDGKTRVKLDSVEVQPGTISDDMVVLDNSDVDGTAIDNSVPVDPAAKAEADKKAAEGSAPADGEAAAAAKPEAEPAEKADDGEN
jgi:hypothetical protein